MIPCHPKGARRSYFSERVILFGRNFSLRTIFLMDCLENSWMESGGGVDSLIRGDPSLLTLAGLFGSGEIPSFSKMPEGRCLLF